MRHKLGSLPEIVRRYRRFHHVQRLYPSRFHCNYVLDILKFTFHHQVGVFEQCHARSGSRANASSSTFSATSRFSLVSRAR